MGHLLYDDKAKTFQIMMNLRSASRQEYHRTGVINPARLQFQTDKRLEWQSGEASSSRKLNA